MTRQFKPIDIALGSVGIRRHEKAEEGMHLVNKPANGFAHGFWRMHQRIALHLESSKLALQQAPDQQIGRANRAGGQW
jgi:hypothetical protein